MYDMRCDSGDCECLRFICDFVSTCTSHDYLFSLLSRSLQTTSSWPISWCCRDCL